MRLCELIVGVEAEIARGDPDVEISDLAYDSQRVGPGTLFFCVRGMAADGHDFAPVAVERGAAALVVERELDLAVPQMMVPDARAAMGPVAVRFWGDPTAELKVAGITGTNGKTTTAFLLRQILKAAGRQTGLLGTVKRVVGGREEEVVRTTPEAIDLQATFRRMLDGGDEACVMEVSSHALALGRSEGISYDVRAFTNLTQDHLDFHSDMEDYFAAKRMLFDLREEDVAVWGTAVVNADDDYGRRLINELRGRGSALTTFSATGADADFRAEEVEFDAGSTRFRCLAPDGEARVEMPLPGHFNVENALAALASASALGVGIAAGAAALLGAERVPGRFEPVDEGQPFTVLVDYAHTPDSLENVLRAARRVTEGRVICVFGCGGDRDREKRPLMGAIGSELSDVCVVTSDNPRSEDPEAIIADILAGVPGRDAVEVEPDRRAAIALALGEASAGDTVVIAGKGHEQGQEFDNGRKISFDDREVATEELRRLMATA
ncbi:MAG TPA: UDP-N-acetylmuramoyl-L-alanyl-D-glutamate--2,6-diaminopimelate ligase [Solirubrobacterales bacterium]|jgi:UDP-N-acetylmuramoyl-L-alanyl-D-glutamate--2,6-diaminopimelate ligase|nr:UDP-N-acetylmuramoyl-L-alanyl-D-glutamate--2,6-diaminopimelate ligase [Solirubrobacterales bacterium]